jgi:hypothetical protein
MICFHILSHLTSHLFSDPHHITLSHLSLTSLYTSLLCLSFHISFCISCSDLFFQISFTSLFSHLSFTSCFSPANLFISFHLFHISLSHLLFTSLFTSLLHVPFATLRDTRSTCPSNSAFAKSSLD